MKCNRCGAENPDNRVICFVCGNNLEEQRDNQNVQEQKGNIHHKKPIEEEGGHDQDNLAHITTVVFKSNRHSNCKKVWDKIKRWSLKKKGIVGGLVIGAVVLLILFSAKIICFHSWEPATCTTAMTCKKCHRKKGSPLGHKWIEATCTEPSKCETCGKTQYEALGHDVTKWEILEGATCTKEGKQEGKCRRCGETITEQIAALGHDWGDWVTSKEATCTEEGVHTRQCKTCKEEETQSITVLGHDWGDWTTTKEATYLEEGEQKRTCKRCNIEESKTIPTLSKEEVEEQLQEKFPDYSAITVLELYGEQQYPYGFELHDVLGTIACEPYDENTWFLKYEVTITNMFGAEYDTVVEARISGNWDNPNVEYFYVY